MHYSLISEVYGETFNTLNSTNLQNKNKILSGGNIIESKINANKQKIESNKKELQNVNKQITDYKIKINNLEKQKSTINNKISSQPKSYWVSEDTTELDSVKNKLKENYKILGNLTRRRGVILTNIENLKNSNTNIITTEKNKQEKLRQEKLKEQREKAKKDKMAARIKAVEGKQEDTSSFTSKYNQLQSADDYKEKSYGDKSEAKKEEEKRKAAEKKYKTKLNRLNNRFKGNNNIRNYYLDILINKYRKKYNILSSKLTPIDKKNIDKINLLQHNYRIGNIMRNLNIAKLKENYYRLYNIVRNNPKFSDPKLQKRIKNEFNEIIKKVNNKKILNKNNINFTEQNLLVNYNKLFKCGKLNNLDCNKVLENLNNWTFEKLNLKKIVESINKQNKSTNKIEIIHKQIKTNNEAIAIAERWVLCLCNEFLYCLKTKNRNALNIEKEKNTISNKLKILEFKKINTNTIDFNKEKIIEDFKDKLICNTNYNTLDCGHLLHLVEQKHINLKRASSGGSFSINIETQLDNSIEKFTDKIKKIENKLCEINTKLYCLKNKKAEKEKAEKEKAEQEEAEIKRKNKEEQDRIAREIAANTSLNKETSSDQYVNLQADNAQQQQDGLKNQEANVQADKHNTINKSNAAGEDVIARSNARNTKALISKDQLDYGESKVKKDLAFIEKKNQAENSRTQSQEDAINSSTKPIIGGTITESNNYIILGLIILFIIDYLSIQ